MVEVSIIMGTYNVARIDLLRKSVESVINQTFQDWELIICDDGSRPDLFSQVKDVSNLDDRIALFQHKNNQGLASALNTCLAHSNGKFIARQDDDDVSATNRIATQVAFLETHSEYAILGSTATYFDELGEWGTVEVPERPTKESFKWNSPFIHPTIMIRSEAVKAVQGYRVARETRRCEDYDLFMRLYAKGYVGFNLRKSLYEYRYSRKHPQKRRFTYRIDEMVVRFRGFKALHMLGKSVPYVFKPLILGLLPRRVYESFWKRRQQKSRNI